MTYYNAEIKLYEDEEKTLAIVLNPKQRKTMRRWEENFKKNINYKKIELQLYKDQKELIEIITKIIKINYKKEEKKHSKEIIEWAIKKTKEVLAETSKEENTIIIYTKKIYNTAKRIKQITTI